MITAVQSGDWNDPETWDSGIPTLLDDVLIEELDVTLQSSCACNRIDISGGSLTFQADTILVVTAGVHGVTGEIVFEGDATITGGISVDEGQIQVANNATVTLTGACTSANDGVLLGTNATIIADGSIGPITGNLKVTSNLKKVFAVKSDPDAVVPRQDGIDALIVVADDVEEASALAVSSRDGDANQVWAAAEFTELNTSEDGVILEYKQ